MWRILAILLVFSAFVVADALPQHVVGARVFVERVAIDSPFWYSSSAKQSSDGTSYSALAKTHGYTVAIFEVDFDTPLSVTRDSLGSGKDDTSFWSSLGDSWRESPLGLLRLSCPGQSFESFPRFSQAAGSANITSQETADALGPPIFLAPLPSSADSAWAFGDPSPASLLRRLDHPVYHVLRSVQEDVTVPGRVSTLRAALVLHHSQPQPRAQADAAWRMPRRLSHVHGHVDVLPVRSLAKCELELLAPESQSIQPPVRVAPVAAAPAAHATGTAAPAGAPAPAVALAPAAVAGRVSFVSAVACAGRRLCLEVSAVASRAAAAVAPAAAADAAVAVSVDAPPMSPAGAHSALSSAARFLRVQGHLDHLALPSASALAQHAAAAAPLSPDDELLLLRSTHPEHPAAYRLAPAAAAVAAAANGTAAAAGAAASSEPVAVEAVEAPMLDSPLKCSFDSDSDPVFLTLSSSMLVQAHVAGVVDGAMQPMQPMIGGVYCGVMGGQLTQSLGSTVVPAVAETVVKDLSRTVPVHLKAYMPSSLAELIKANLPGRVLRAVSDYVTWTLANKLSDDMMTRSMPTVVEDVIRRVALISPGRAAAMATTRLAHALTRSLTHAVVPALTKTLEYSPLRQSWCEACRKEFKLCQYCWQNNSHLQAGLYYAGYYSTYYGDYYTRYFMDELGGRRRELKEHELEIERLRSRFEVIRAA